MKASEIKLQQLLEGTKQFVVPLFQRTYDWDTKEWNQLWSDLEELYDTENPRPHFIGSIVNMPSVSVPEGVPKFLLIDGQQRLTTILVLLTLLRDKSRDNGNADKAEEINNTLIVNPYKKQSDFYKLLPTQVDRDNFMKLITSSPLDATNKISKAYKYFDKKLSRNDFDFDRIVEIITAYLSVVSITLEADDNPYLVFESLNAKGKPLSQADLIRNYFFMRIHVNDQEHIYNSYWLPMQEILGENLTEFIRHFLMRNGALVKQSDVYYSLKEKVTQGNAINYLQSMVTFSRYYQKLLYPETEADIDIRRALARLNRIEVTTAYPLLLNLFDNYANGKLTKEDFTQILNTIENFLIRRLIEGIPTNQLNKIFPSIYPQLKANFENNYVEGMKKILQAKGYPKDTSFKASFMSAKIYGAGDRADKAKLILETIEEYFGHKEKVPFTNLTVEHIMPQTLSEWWQNHLEEDWDVTHELMLHNIGNLTLTAYNSELSNDDFASKKEVYSNSHLELNKYFESIITWNKDAIENRAEYLADVALKIWAYFGDNKDEIKSSEDVTGTIPAGFWFLEQYFEVGSWRDVLEETLNAISELDAENFETIIKQFPALIGKDKNRFRAVRELRNGYFIEVNLSAKNIQQFCYQAVEIVGLSYDDLKIEYGEVTDTGKRMLKKDSPKFTPVNFHVKCMGKIKEYLHVDFVKISSSTFESLDKGIGIVCSVSKLHERRNQLYWFAFHPRQVDFLSKFKSGFVAFGCGSAETIILFPMSEFIPLLDKMNTTERDDLKYWHVKIGEENSRYQLALPNYSNAIDITKYLIS